MDKVEDTLDGECRRIGLARGEEVLDRPRPITTGILEVKKNKYINRKNIDYVDTAEAAPSTLRPRAPLAGRRRVRDAGDGTKKEYGTVRQSRVARGDKSTRNSRSKKSNSITVLWDSLHHFSKNNLGRTLTDQVSKGLVIITVTPYRN
jgi:hypothetical protein